MNKYNYLLVFTLPAIVAFSFHLEGALTFLPLGIYFILVPLLELLIPPLKHNMEKSEKQQVKEDHFFQGVLLTTVPVQVGLMVYFLYSISTKAYSPLELAGVISAMGLSCGVLGLNVGHELGHRQTRWEQLMGEIMLLSSLNTHFLPYHNGGHHKNVATPADAATARKNEILFIFWLRSHFTSYTQAWQLENQRMQQEGKPWFSLSNRMVVYTLINLFLLSSLYLIQPIVLWGFLGAAVFGIVLLETVNYIEQYGLLRKKVNEHRYERVKHIHSWNSDHLLGRSILFNLSRHSDHHYNGSKEYQLLDSLEKSPQMPTGYPGMMMLSLAQPLWFKIMNKKLESVQD